MCSSASKVKATVTGGFSFFDTTNTSSVIGQELTNFQSHAIHNKALPQRRSIELRTAFAVFTPPPPSRNMACTENAQVIPARSQRRLHAIHRLR
jgi:hypothetical protein